MRIKQHPQSEGFGGRGSPECPGTMNCNKAEDFVFVSVSTVWVSVFFALCGPFRSEANIGNSGPLEVILSL